VHIKWRMAEGDDTRDSNEADKQAPILEAAEKVPFLLSNDSTTAYGEEVKPRVSIPIEATSQDHGERTMYVPRPTHMLTWSPNPDAMKMMLEMGISENAARRALYNTGNESAELAAGWVFDNLHLPNLYDPFVPYAHPPSPGAPSSADQMLPAAVNPVGEQEMCSLLKDSSWKMVFVVNSELRMGVGKVAAQVGHATLGLYKQVISDKMMNDLTQWEAAGATKIVLSGKDASTLFSLQNEANTANLSTYVVFDAGRTQVLPGSITILGVFGHCSVVDRITGSLKLL